MQNPALTFHQHLVQLPEPVCSRPAGRCILLFFFLVLRLAISVATFFNCEHRWLNWKAAVQRLGKQHLGNSWLLAWWGLQSNKYVHETMFSNYRAGNRVSGRDSALKSNRSCWLQTRQQRFADKDNCHTAFSMPLQKGLTAHSTFWLNKLRCEQQSQQTWGLTDPSNSPTSTSQTCWW